MKNRIARVSASVLLLVGLLAQPALAAESQIEVVLQGAPVQFDTEPLIENNRTLVPLRALSERLGFTVGWDAATQQITLTKAERTVILWVGQTEASVDGRSLTLEAAPKIVGDRTFVPLRFIAEQLGAKVYWDGGRRQVRTTPADASDPEALSWLLSTQAEQPMRVATTGEFWFQASEPGRAPTQLKGRLNLLQNGQQDALGQIQLSAPAGTTELPVGPLTPAAGYQARIDRAAGFLLLYPSWFSPWASKPTGAGQETGLTEPSGLAQVAALLKGQAAVTFGETELQDGKQLVRVDVELPDVAFEQ
jgi:hypothetical protein